MTKLKKTVALLLAVLLCVGMLQIGAGAISLQDPDGVTFLVEQTKGERTADLPTPEAGTMTAQKSGELQADGTVKITIETKATPITTYDPVDVIFIVDESGSMNMLSNYTNYPMPCLNDDHWYRFCPAQARMIYNLTDEEFQYNVEHLEQGERLLSDIYVSFAGTTAQSVQTSTWSAYAAEFVKAVSAGVYADGTPLLTSLYVKQPVDDTDETEYEWVLSDNVIKYAAVNTYNGTTAGNDDYTLLCYEHYVRENGSFRKITDLPTSYHTNAYAWSPADDNADGCFDRMMLCKQAIRKLSAQIWSANSSSRVAYAGFASSLTHGVDFTDYATEQQTGALETVLTDYSGYSGTGPAYGTKAAARYMNNRSAETKDRDCYVIYLSDGKPQYASGAYTPYYYIRPYTVLWTDATVYAIGMDMFNDAAAKTSITGFATADPYFYGGNVANAFFTYGQEELEDVLGIIKQSMYSTYPVGTLTDQIGPDFELITDANHPITVGDAVFTASSARAAGYNADTASFSWKTTDVPEQTYSFFVKPKELKAGAFLTNADAEVDGTLTTGATLQYYAVSESENVPVMADELTEIQLPSPEITMRRPWQVKYVYVGDVPAEAEDMLPQEQSYYNGDNVDVAPSLPTLNGFAFSGWSNEEGAATLTEDGKMPASDVIFIGSWEPATTYTLHYEYEGVVIPAGAQALLPGEEYHCAGEAVEIADDPAVSNYVFTGWKYKSDSAHLVDDATMPTGDVTLVGAWVSEQTYEVRYEFEGEVPAGAANLLPDAAQYHAGDTVTAAADPTLKGYTFTGWTLVDAETGSTFIMPEHDVVLVGGFERITYTGTHTITFFAPDRVSFYIEGIGYIIDSETITVDANRTVRFKPLTSYGDNTTLVYINQEYVTPDEEGWYSVDPSNVPVLVSVTPGYTDQETGKAHSFWEMLLNFVMNFFNSIKKLFSGKG